MTILLRIISRSWHAVANGYVAKEATMHEEFAVVAAVSAASVAAVADCGLLSA
jgi:hypothetical protein